MRPGGAEQIFTEHQDPDRIFDLRIRVGGMTMPDAVGGELAGVFGHAKADLETTLASHATEQACLDGVSFGGRVERANHAPF